MTTLRWGFLGASRIGHKTLAPAVRAAGHTLQAVAARDAGRAGAYARELGFARSYGSYEELLADPAVDAVYNALPNDLHMPLTVAALQAGKHVLCEKPLALNAAEVQRIREAAEKSGRLMLEAFAYRFHPQFARTLELAHGGALGELRFGRAAFGFRLDRDDDFRWLPGKGGGALYDVGCYDVNFLRLLARREPLQASATQRERGGVDADLAGLLDFGEFKAHFDCSFTVSSQWLSVVGSEAELHLGLPFLSRNVPVELRVGDTVEVLGPADPYALMVEHFGRAVHGAEPLRFTLDDAYGQARTLDALFESVREGRTVSL